MTSLIKLPSLLKYFAAQDWIEKNEALCSPKEIQLKIYKDEISQFIKTHEMTLSTIEKDKNLGQKKIALVVRNTCYIFQRTAIFFKEKLASPIKLADYVGNYIFFGSPPKLFYVQSEDKTEELTIQDSIEYKQMLEVLIKKVKRDPTSPLQRSLQDQPDLLKKFVKIIVENKGHERVLRIDKTAPYEEFKGGLPKEMVKQYPVFLKIGGKSHNSQHVFEDKVIEICREHGHGVAKHELDEAKEKKRPPRVHYVVSNSYKGDLSYFCGEYNAHADSETPPSFIVRSLASQFKKSVQLLCHNLLSDEQDLKLVAVAPVQPFYYYVIEKLEKAITSLEKHPDIQLVVAHYLQEINDKVLGNIFLTDYESESYFALKTILLKMESTLNGKPSGMDKYVNKLLLKLEERHKIEKENLKKEGATKTHTKSTNQPISG